MREFDGPRKYREAATAARREAWTVLTTAYSVTDIVPKIRDIEMHGVHPTVELKSPNAVRKYRELMQAHDAYHLLYNAETEINYDRAKRMRERAYQLLDLNQHAPAATGPASST